MDNHVNDLKKRIKNALADLTENQKRIANAILEHPQKFALSSIRQLEEELNTSKATIVRFTQALGYEGFPEVRSLLLDGLRKEAGPINRYRSLLEYSDQKKKNNHLQLVAEESIDNIRRTLKLVDGGQWDKTISLLINVDHVYTMGLGISAILSQLASYLFNRVALKSSSLESRSLSFSEQIVNLSPKDLIFAFSFPPYSKETIAAAEYAQEENINVISITDKSTNDIIRYSDAYLIAKVDSSTISNSISAVQVILYGLCTHIGHELKNKTLATIEAIEHVRKEHS